MTSRNLKERLILEGIIELNKSGVQNFSVRRVAAQCGVSCATPYKYFKDRQGFIAGMVEYIQSQWAERQRKVYEDERGGTREQIVAVCLEYVRFLVENPYFRSVIMIKDEELDREYGVRRGMSLFSKELVRCYCDEVGMSEDTEKFKTYVVRSLLYGASLMFDNGELEYNEENMDIVKRAISREFDLP